MKKLYRCRWDKKIAGVCGGLGQFFGIDPSLIRMILVFLTCVTGFFPCIIGYAILAFILPQGPSIYVEIPGKKFYKSWDNKAISGLLAGLGSYFGLDVSFVRIGYLVLTIATAFFPGIITYLVASSIVPYSPFAKR